MAKVASEFNVVIIGLSVYRNS